MGDDFHGDFNQTMENIDNVDMGEIIKGVMDEKKRKEELAEELLALGDRYSCQGCGLNFKVDFEGRPPKCADCESSNMKFIGKEYYTKTQYEEALEKFQKEKLLKLILDELSKTHIGDDNLKMTSFLTCVSGLLKDQKKRMSLAITGDSSEGKDNNIKTSLKHIPRDLAVFLTSGTQATIEDDINDLRIIAFSEVNANRDNGANKYLIEVIKQKTDGGTSSIKKDIRTGMKTARHEKGEQGSVLFGTTEARMDEEMKTRFIKGTIETDPVRIKKVNDNTLDTFSDLKKLLDESVDIDSWIRVGLSWFFYHKEQQEVYLPYAKFLKEEVNGKFLFDHNNPRSQRDIKRVLALTCAMAYLHQEQRAVIEHNGHKILVSEPQDFINTLIITGEFFNQSYSGLDKRLNRVLEFIIEKGTRWVARDDIQKSLDVSRNTIKEYCSTLANEGMIEGSSGKILNEAGGLKSHNSNKIYYRRCQKGVKKPLIRCQVNELKTFLEEKTKKKLDTFLFTPNSDDKNNKRVYQKRDIKNKKILENDGNLDISSEIDPLKLTPLGNAPNREINEGESR